MATVVPAPTRTSISTSSIVRSGTSTGAAAPVAAQPRRNTTALIAIVDKIVEGKLQKWYAENTLLEQAFVKDPDRKIIDVVNAAIAKLGENIQVRRFVRFALGEMDT